MLEAYGDGGFSGAVCGDSAHGILFERSVTRGRVLRDWFVATPESVELVGGGAGRWHLVRNHLETKVEVYLMPKPDGWPRWSRIQASISSPATAFWHPRRLGGTR